MKIFLTSRSIARSPTVNRNVSDTVTQQGFVVTEDIIKVRDIFHAAKKRKIWSGFWINGAEMASFQQKTFSGPRSKGRQKEALFAGWREWRWSRNNYLKKKKKKKNRHKGK